MPRGGKRKNAGRPPARGKTATEMTWIRLTAEEKRQWLAAARARGLSLSAWLRLLAMDAIRGDQR